MNKEKARTYLTILTIAAFVFLIWFYITVMKGSGGDIEGLLVDIL